ncbi:MAG: hypothetical protein GVY26_15935 [Bacteroidetes bacterium]|nr:hypothetical protein [Bacteroidota bacterium]
MSHNTPHIFLSLLLVLCCSFTAVGQTDAAQPSIDVLHYSQGCNAPLPAVPPVVPGYDPTDYQLTHKDKTYELGCASRGFTGYFALSRWEGAQEQGDDGVDVTGAPNSVLVEGANSASIMVLPGSEASLGIVLPADGFITFDWGYIGGSPFYNQHFTIYINDEPVEGLSADHLAGTYISRGLEAGDELRFEAAAAKKGFQIRIHQFEFLTNANAVVAREWRVHTTDGLSDSKTQWIALEKPDFSRLLFPRHFDGSQQPMLQDGRISLPAATGYPAMDTDGDWATTHDQIVLDEERYGLQATWEDEMVYDGQRCVIYRHWTVRDLCGDNVQAATQVIMLQGGCPTNLGTWPPVQRTESEPFSQPAPHQSIAAPQIISYNDTWKGLPAEDPFFP